MTEIILITSIIVCLLYIIAEKFAHARQSGHLADILYGPGRLRTLNLKYLTGISMFSIPLLQWFFGGYPTNIFLEITMDKSGIIIWTLAMFLSIFSVSNASRNRIQTDEQNNNLTKHPSFHWTGTLILRTLFLLLYEIFMRGVFLFAAIELLGIPMAIILNVFIYFIMHIYSDRKTLIGTIPFGLLVCWLSIRMNSIWPAALLHIGMGILYEILLLNHFQKTLKPVAR
jgi:membrane protease YdiL (CAAX protease family)